MKGTNFGTFINRIRIHKKLSLADVSERSGISAATLSRYENHVRSPKPNNLKKLAVGLDVPYESLLAAAGYLEPIVESEGFIPKEEDNRKLVCIDVTNYSVEQLESIETALGALLKSFKNLRRTSPHERSNARSLHPNQALCSASTRDCH